MSRILGKGCCDITNMFKVIIDCWLFDFFCEAKLLFLFHSIGICISLHLHFKTPMPLHEGYCNLNCHLVLTSMLFPHQVDIGKT